MNRIYNTLQGEYPREIRMKLFTELNIQLRDNILEVKNLSDFMCARIRIIFKNEYSLSVIQGYGTYGAKGNLFEVAVYNNAEEFVPNFLTEGDTVQGYLTPEQVLDIAKKVSELNPRKYKYDGLAYGYEIEKETNNFRHFDLIKWICPNCQHENEILSVGFDVTCKNIETCERCENVIIVILQEDIEKRKDIVTW